MPFLAPTLDTPDPLSVLVITQGFNLHHEEVVEQDPGTMNIRWNNEH